MYYNVNLPHCWHLLGEIQANPVVYRPATRTKLYFENICCSLSPEAMEVHPVQQMMSCIKEEKQWQICFKLITS
jgi:hypothetical protein